MEPAANATPPTRADDAPKGAMTLPWKLGGTWSTEHTTGAVALGALAFLIAVRIAFRGALGD